jgi:hypothetical protein
VIEHLLKAAEIKAEEARQRADERALTEAAKIPDLEDEDVSGLQPRHYSATAIA